jgi:hypothetical protein
MPHYAKLLREARPDDQVIEAVVSTALATRHLLYLGGGGR